MYYGLKPIKEGQLRFVNFASHFIRIQIFQIVFHLISKILLTPLTYSAMRHFVHFRITWERFDNLEKLWVKDQWKLKAALERILVIVQIDLIWSFFGAAEKNSKKVKCWVGFQ